MRINSTIKLKFDSDFALISFIGLYYLFHALNLFVKLALNEPSWWGLFSKAILAGTLGCALVVILNRYSRIILVEFFVMWLLLISFARGTLSTDYSEVSSVIFNFVLVYVPLGLAVYSVRDMRRMLASLYKFAWVSTFILWATILMRNSLGLFDSSVADGHSYDMSIGYSLLFQILVILDHYFEKHNIKDLAVVVISTAAIALFSSRTPLLCIVVYVYIRMFESKNIRKRTKIILLVATVFVIIGGILFYAFLAEPLYTKLVSMGYKSVALRKLLLNPLDDSNRTWIYVNYLDHTLKAPLFGYGILGGWFLGTYPHNIVLEFIHSFGIVLGSLFFVWIVSLVVKGMKSSERGLVRVIIVLSAYNVYLFLSGSFLTSMTFGMLIGACLKAKRMKYIVADDWLHMENNSKHINNKQESMIINVRV